MMCNHKLEEKLWVTEGMFVYHCKLCGAVFTVVNGELERIR